MVAPLDLFLREWALANHYADLGRGLLLLLLLNLHAYEWINY